MKKASKILKSFSPAADKNSKILILGTMPGPMALAKQEYYGFPGNHFWKIIPALFDITKPLTYPEKIQLLKDKGIALWDVFESCERKSAADSDIQCAEYNDIPGLLKRHPKIRAVFTDSKIAEKVYVNYFAKSVKLPHFYLPSPSPAHASISLPEKIKKWSVILDYLK